MSRRLFLAVFEREDDLLGATAAVRAEGLRIVDVYTPYAVHGLDEAMGLKPSRLSRACLTCGAIGVAVALWLQYWTMTVDWPINVGGRPWNSLPAFVPVTFEVMVLFAGLGVVLAFFIVSRLYPGKRARIPLPDTTGSRFVLVLEEGAAFDSVKVKQLLTSYHATLTEEREEQVAETVPGRKRSRLNVALGILLAVLVVLTYLTGHDPGRPNLEFLPEMARSVPYDSFAPNPHLPDGRTLQAPVPGTVARGQMPLHYRATPEDAVRAGKELHNPFAAGSAPWRERGAFLFTNYCAVCHGPAGDGKGSVTGRGVPAASLLAEKAVQLPDGQMFHVLTYGQVNMASYAGQLSVEDRWQVILRVRELQKAAGEKKP